MGRILAIDFGSKKTGLAVTDPRGIIAQPLDTIATDRLMAFLKDYVPREEVHCIVVGEPSDYNGDPAPIVEQIENFVRGIEKRFPEVLIEIFDESLSSREARKTMLLSGLGRKKRADKWRVDRVAATIMLQEYLEDRSA